MTIDGNQVSAQDTFAVKNPSTGDVVGQAPQASLGDLDTAVAAAKKAFETWSLKSDEELQAACEAVTAKIGEYAEELATLVTKEQGKPLNGLGSRWELGGAGAWAGYTSGLSLLMKPFRIITKARLNFIANPLALLVQSPRGIFQF